MQTLYIDIETGPVSRDEIDTFIRPFDPKAVKTGNLKDQEKISAKIAEAAQSHVQDYYDRAALWAPTGQVIAIGLMEPDGSFECLGNETGEKYLLENFWGRFLNPSRVITLIGWNIKSFDMVFLLQRSWKHGVKPAPYIFQDNGYISDRIIDLRERWRQRVYDMKGNLDEVAKFLGVGQKNGDGADFAQLWILDRKKAIEYLKNDCDMVRKIHPRMAL